MTTPTLEPTEQPSLPSSSLELSGAEAAVATLVANGIDVVFGIPGGHSFPIYAALAKEKRIRHVLGRHEQGLGFMAEGYHRASGKLAAVSITSGPAVANIASSLGQATTDTAGVLVIASAPASSLIGRNRGGLHDLNDALDAMKAVCRYAEHCPTGADISPTIASVIKNLREGRPGGAFVQIPTDVLAKRTQVEIVKASEGHFHVDQSLIAAAARLLETARRPLIIAGTGAVVSGAGAELTALAQRLGAVVSTTTLARGVVAGSQPFAIFPDGPSSTEVNAVFENADVVLAVGTMFKQEDTCNWSLKMGSRLIHIDIDPQEFGRSYQADIAIPGNAKTACLALLEELKTSPPVDPEWIASARKLQEARLAARRPRHPMEMKFIEQLRETIPSDVMIFADRCNIGYWMCRCMPCEEPRTFHYPLGYGGLGGSLPQAIGAKIACKERRILSILGDGGMQFTLPELAVAVQENVGIKIIITNNSSYGAIKAGMKKNYGEINFGTDLSGPDWQKIASAYDIPFHRYSAPNDFINGLGAEMENDGLSITEFVNDIADPQ